MSSQPTICAHCGQPVLPSHSIPLPPLKSRILDLVRRHPGIQAETLRELVWADDPNGGPEDRKAIHVHVHQLNRALEPYGLRVRGSRSFGLRVEEILADMAMGLALHRGLDRFRRV